MILTELCKVPVKTESVFLPGNVHKNSFITCRKGVMPGEVRAS